MYRLRVPDRYYNVLNLESDGVSLLENCIVDNVLLDNDVFVLISGDLNSRTDFDVISDVTCHQQTWGSNPRQDPTKISRRHGRMLYHSSYIPFTLVQEDETYI